MLSTPGLETPRRIQDRPGVNSDGNRVDEGSPNARRTESHPDPDIAVNTCSPSLPRSQARYSGGQHCVVYQPDAGARGDVRAPRQILESPSTDTRSSSSRSQSALDDDRGDNSGGVMLRGAATSIPDSAGCYGHVGGAKNKTVSSSVWRDCLDDPAPLDSLTSATGRLSGRAL